MFELWEINDIIDKHKGKPAVIECHGPSASVNRKKINKLHKNKKIIVIGINEWCMFKDHPRPDYWLRCHTGANGGWTVGAGKWKKYLDRCTDNGTIPLLNCDTADSSTLESAKKNLDGPYLPYDNRHFGGRTCEQNYKMDGVKFAPSASKFFPDCCDRKGRLTIQEEFQKYTKYPRMMSASSFTASVYMINFAVLMGCNPVYINGMDLDYFGQGGVYTDLTKEGHDTLFKQFKPGEDSWKGWRREWMERDFNIINQSAKNIGVKILNLNHDTWYGIFDNGYLTPTEYIKSIFIGSNRIQFFNT